MQLSKLEGIYVRAPLRLSLAGGGTDFPEYFEKYGGTTISSAALGYYVHINVRRLTDLFDSRFRLEYYEVEHCDKIDEIKNDIIRGVFTLLSWDLPVYVSVVSDIPSSSGLGSSSAFAVGLILALTRMRDGKTLPPDKLCSLAIEVELGILNRSMGIQDCLPVAYGGFRIFKLRKKDQFSTSHKVSLTLLDDLVKMKCLAMIWTGGQRDSGTVLREQKNQINNKKLSYDRIKLAAEKFTSELITENLNHTDFRESIINVLNSSQTEKVKISSNAVTPRIKELMNLTDSLKVAAQRLVGAGNGGFILAVSREPFIDKLAEHRLRFIQPKFSAAGAEIRFEE